MVCALCSATNQVAWHYCIQLDRAHCSCAININYLIQFTTVLEAQIPDRAIAIDSDSKK